jgi:hypothetical protein
VTGGNNFGKTSHALLSNKKPEASQKKVGNKLLETSQVIRGNNRGKTQGNKKHCSLFYYHSFTILKSEQSTPFLKKLCIVNLAKEVLLLRQGFGRTKELAPVSHPAKNQILKVPTDGAFLVPTSLNVLKYSISVLRYGISLR